MLKNEQDEDVNVAQLAENGLVMFVVPKADTREFQTCQRVEGIAEDNIQLVVIIKRVHSGMHMLTLPKRDTRSMA